MAQLPAPNLLADACDSVHDTPLITDSVAPIPGPMPWLQFMGGETTVDRAKTAKEKVIRLNPSFSSFVFMVFHFV